MKFLFEYLYKENDFLVAGYDVIKSSGLETACAEFEKYNAGKFISYEVYLVGEKVK